MKKRFFFMAAFGAAAAIAFVCHLRADQQQITNEVMLRNIEALADDEYDNVYCFGMGCLDCPINAEKVKYVISGYSLE